MKESVPQQPKNVKIDAAASPRGNEGTRLTAGISQLPSAIKKAPCYPNFPPDCPNFSPGCQNLSPSCSPGIPSLSPSCPNLSLGNSNLLPSCPNLQPSYPKVSVGCPSNLTPSCPTLPPGCPTLPPGWGPECSYRHLKTVINDDVAPPPLKGWSPVPGQYPPVPDPKMIGPCCPILPPSWGPCAATRCVVPAQQPVVPIPVYQEIQKKDRIIEVPQTVLKDSVRPKLYQQDINYEVPRLRVHCREKPVIIPQLDFKEKIIEVPVPVGYNYKVSEKWEIREVPKVIPKYVGEQEDIYVEIPQVKVVDRHHEKEVPVYVGEKIVRKQVIEEVPEEVVNYQYVEQEEEVPIFTYKPVFDVQVDIPPPLIVPVPVRPKEIQLEAERMPLDQWKRIRYGGGCVMCNEHNACGPFPADPCCICSGQGACTQGCHPGNCCSPGGLAGAFCSCNPRKMCTQCQKDCCGLQEQSASTPVAY